MIRILLADDQLLFRSMLVEMLQKDSEVEVVASASNGEEAVAFALKYKPDVVLLDVQMPVKTGIEALKEIKERLPDIKVAMLTTFEDEEGMTASFKYGADGYLVKDIKPQALIMALKCMYYDLSVFHKSVCSSISSSMRAFSTASTEKISFGEFVFDSIDIMIMKQITDGKTNKEIAKILNYSEGTVKNRVSKILSKTGLSDRFGISLFAIKNQII